MKVKTLGSRTNPAILMIPGMFCTGDMPEKAARFLEKEYSSSCRPWTDTMRRSRSIMTNRRTVRRLFPGSMITGLKSWRFCRVHRWARK